MTLYNLFYYHIQPLQWQQMFVNIVILLEYQYFDGPLKRLTEQKNGKKKISVQMTNDNKNQNIKIMEFRVNILTQTWVNDIGGIVLLKLEK